MSLLQAFIGGSTPTNVFDTPIASEPTFNVESTKIIASEAGRFLARASVIQIDTLTVLSYIERDDHGVGNPTIHVRFSTDYGDTWTDEDTYTDGNPVSGFPYTDTVGTYLVRIGQAPNGDLVMLRRTDSFRSSDLGKTWTTFSVVWPNLDADDYGAGFTAYDHTITLGNRMYWPSKQFVTDGYTNPQAYVNRLKFHYSDDNGATFQTTGKVIATWPIPPENDNLTGANPPTKGADEPMMLYTGNGLFRFAGRVVSVDGFYGMTAPSFGQDDITISDLSGQINWAAGRLSGYQRALIQGKKINWETDPVIFAFGFEFTIPGSGDDRRHCFIASKDKGVTWIGPYYLDAVMHDGGYGDAIYNPNTDEYVFISYYELNSGDKATIKQYNISIDWV